MKKFLKPAPGLLVRNPITRKMLPEEGDFCDWNGRYGKYWRRRVMVGDCQIVDPESTDKLNKLVDELNIDD